MFYYEEDPSFDGSVPPEEVFYDYGEIEDIDLEAVSLEEFANYIYYEPSLKPVPGTRASPLPRLQYTS